MTRTTCDKCNAEDSSISKIFGEKALFGRKTPDGVNYIITNLDLCDGCRHYLGEIIREWLDKD